jgi:hypothetical protein
MKELSMHIMDIAQNSIRAKANLIRIKITEHVQTQNQFLIEIEDNGIGISSENLEKVTDPFYTTTTKKTGLGLALLEQNARQAGGFMKIDSTGGNGTNIVASFCHDHFDRQPLGDIASTITGLIRMNPDIDFIYTHIYNQNEFNIDTRIIKQEIGNVEIADGRVISFLKGMIEESLEEIQQ